MLRVLTLSTLFPDATRPNFGGFVERQTLALARRDDVQVTVAAPVGLPPWPLSRHPRYAALAGLPAREEWRGLEVWRPCFLNLPGTGGRFHAAAVARALAPLLRHLSFDVIDAEYFFPDGPAAVALGRRLGLPVSIKARGSDVHHWGNLPVTAGQVRAAGLAADGLLAVSAAMRDDMIALGMPATSIHVHRTGVDPCFAAQDRAAARAASGIAGPLVLSVGALVAGKGHDVLIDAMAALPGVSLLIAGEGPERAALAGRIAGHGLGERVRLIGAVPHAHMPALHAAADVMALASHAEGLANAWVEALATGTPVVTTDVGGARELVTPACGRLVARTPEAFAAAIRELIAHPPAPGTVRAAVADYSWETNATALAAHLRGLVEARARSR